MCVNVRVRPAIGYTSGNKPDSVSLVRGKTGKTPSYYIKKALKSGHIKEREKRLLRSLLRAFEEGNYGAGVKDEFYGDNYTLTLGDLLFKESEDAFIDFIEDAMFSSQDSYETWYEEGFIIENKREGAKSVFRAIRNNPNRYRLVISMKNKKGSGIIFKDLLTGKTLLPRKWGAVKGLGIGKFYIVRVDDGRVSRILTR